MRKLILKKIYLSLLFVIVVFILGHAQNSNPAYGKSKILIFSGIGRSIFATNVLPSQTRNPTPELRAGFSFIRSVKRKLEIEVRPAFGIKLKGDKSGFQSPDNFLRESTNFDFKFLEIPVFLSYSVWRLVKLKGGFSPRIFKSGNNVPYAFLEGKIEIGIITGASFLVSEKLSLGVEYNFGLTRVLEMGYFNSQLQPQNGILIVRNQVGQVIFCYRLR